MTWPRALPVPRGPLRGPFRAGQGGGGAAGGVQPAGPLTPPPGTGPSLDEEAGAASAARPGSRPGPSGPDPPAPQPLPPNWLSGRCADRVSWPRGCSPRHPLPGCPWPPPQAPELGRALGAAGRPCPPSGPFPARLPLPALCSVSVVGLLPARPPSTGAEHRPRLGWPWGGWRSHPRARGGARVCTVSLGVGQTRPGLFAGGRQPGPLSPRRPRGPGGRGPATLEGPSEPCWVVALTADTRDGAQSRPGRTCACTGPRGSRAAVRGPSLSGGGGGVTV